jgi:hypothetical protein
MWSAASLVSASDLTPLCPLNEIRRSPVLAIAL